MNSTAHDGTTYRVERKPFDLKGVQEVSIIDHSTMVGGPKRDSIFKSEFGEDQHTQVDFTQLNTQDNFYLPKRMGNNTDAITFSNGQTQGFIPKIEIEKAKMEYVLRGSSPKSKEQLSPKRFNFGSMTNVTRNTKEIRQKPLDQPRNSRDMVLSDYTNFKSVQAHRVKMMNANMTVLQRAKELD